MSSIAQKIKDKVNIVDFMLEDGLQLRQEGTGKYTCLCPFHNEKTPSFKVSEIYQNYKCFGCGESGDVISYYAKRNNIDNGTALVLLAEKYGIPLDNGNKIEEYKSNKELYELNKDLENFYKNEFKKLPNTHPAKQQILNRNLKITEDDFGYAPNDRISMLKYMADRGYTIEQLKELGHINEKGNIQQVNRLIFFIRNYMGSTIGFTGRALDNTEINFKYVNSKASSVYDKKSALYNIDKAKKKAQEEKEIYIVEGQFDVMAMVQHGYENTVCISGTAFTNNIIKDINRCVTVDGHIILMLDSDKAGQKAMMKIFQEFPILHSRLYIILLPSGLDPCDYLKEHKKLPEKKLLIESMYDALKNKYDFSKVEDKNSFINQVKKSILNYITDTNLKELYYRNACSIVGITYNSNDVVSNNVDKDTKIDAVTAKEKVLEKLSDEDKYYVSSLAFYITNKDSIDYTINEKDYPKRYKKFVVELKELIDNNKKYNTDYFSMKNLPKIISSLDFDLIEDKKLATSHYKMLLNNAQKIEQRKINQERLRKLKDKVSNLNQEETIEFLRKNNL